MNEYEVLKVAAGRYAPKRLRGAHWGILDGAARPVTELPGGATVTLVPSTTGATTTVTATPSKPLGQWFVRAGVTGN